MFGIGDAVPHRSLQNFFGCVCCPNVECHYLIFFTNIIINVLFHYGDNWYYWLVYVCGYPIWTTDLGFQKLGNFSSAIAYHVCATGPSFRILE